MKKIGMLLAVLTVHIAAIAQYDWTGRLKNPSFEQGTTGWTLTKTTSGWQDMVIKTSGSADGSQHYNLWAQNVTKIDLNQMVTLPAGEYTLTAQLSTDAAGLNDQHIYAMVGSNTFKSSAMTASDQWQQLSVSFSLTSEQSVTLGALGTGTGSGQKGWFCADDFRLTGAQVDTEINESIAQLADAIELTGSSELHITGSEPFATTGFVNFAETDHAVLYLDSLRPSEAVAWLSHITIKGETAASEKNCQLRLYDHGTLLLPYGKENKSETGFHPLTVYAEQNCQGESCDLFGIENTKGYMNTLTDEKLNNRIRSFRLKRGYMVTFSLQEEGWGYQRCFIADDADLVVNTLPDIMDKRISSYRIFRFNNIGKNGVANILNTDNLKKLNCTWTYAWGAGNSLGTDYECVPHMNNLWSATTYNLGVNDQSPYMKTDNEPANSNDNNPATVDQELERWNDLMRTGRRLLSPSSFDSGEWWHKQFLDSIDARGWRCDIIDIHSYWNESSFNNIKSNWADKFGRPVWITEFIWGASWSGGFGIFGVATTSEERGNPSDATLQKNAEVLTRIWTNLNSMDYVERYAYWNDEWACSKILWNGNLTPAGEVYSKMKTGTSYAGTYQFVPTDWRLEPSKNLAGTYDADKRSITLSWHCYNGDLDDAMTLQRRLGDGDWEDVYTWDDPDGPTYTYTDSASASALYAYRIKERTYKSTTLYSSPCYVTVAFSSGTEDLQYGTLGVVDNEEQTVTCLQQTDKPHIFMSAPTFNNTTMGLVPHVKSVSKAKFVADLAAWTLPEGTAMTSPETVDYIAIKTGQYQWGKMRAEVDTCSYVKADGTVSKMSNGDTIRVDFHQPFPADVVPVVIVQPISSLTMKTAIAKVFDVDNLGFSMKLVGQSGGDAVRQQYTFYIAITPGSANLDEEGMSIHAGRFTSPVGGSTKASCKFVDPQGEQLYFRSPFILEGTQTHRLDFASQLRRAGTLTSTVTDSDGVKYKATTGVSLRRLMDTALTTTEIGTNTATKNGDEVGWIVVDNSRVAEDLTGIEEVNPEDASSDDTYDLAGRKLRAITHKGIYIIGGKKVLK